MQEVMKKRQSGLIGRWLKSFGMSVRLFVTSFSVASFRSLNWEQFRFHCRWMGEGSVPLIVLSAVFISIAITSQVVLELQRFGAEDLAGPFIALGLLRELGPLTVSLIWCVRIAVFICAEVCDSPISDNELAGKFILPRYLAALFSAIPLSILGLVAGIAAGALYAPLLGVGSSTDFMEGTRNIVKDKDVFAFFLKLLLVNPTIAVFAGYAAGRVHHSTPTFAVADAVMTLGVIAAIANFAVTFAIYMP